MELASMTSAMQRYNSLNDLSQLSLKQEQAKQEKKNTQKQKREETPCTSSLVEEVIDEEIDEGDDTIKGMITSPSLAKMYNQNKQQIEKQFKGQDQLKKDEGADTHTYIYNANYIHIYNYLSIYLSIFPPSYDDLAHLLLVLKRWLLWELIYRACRRWLKGFLLGYSAKAILGFVSLFIKIRANITKVIIYNNII